MSELVARGFLRALFHAAQSLLRYAPEHEAVKSAVSALQSAAEVLTSGQPEAVITVGEDALFLGPQMLPHASMEFHGMRRDLQQRGIDSITVLRGATERDLTDLAAVVAGPGADLPVGGTVRINERPVSPAELEVRPLSGLRRTYTASLDALRAVSSGRRLELGRVAGAVEGFLRGGAAEGGPSLMLATLHNHDETTFYHGVNVCLLSLALGRAVGLGDDDLRRLGMGALLIDIGRVVLDDPALRLPGRLSNEEWALVRLHPQEGALAILAATRPGEEIAAQIALEHHVRFDGGGYPDLGGRRPHLLSRLVAVADAYDAITSHRPHRPARTPQEACGILVRGAGERLRPGRGEGLQPDARPVPAGLAAATRVRRGGHGGRRRRGRPAGDDGSGPQRSAARRAGTGRSHRSPGGREPCSPTTTGCLRRRFSKPWKPRRPSAADPCSQRRAVDMMTAAMPLLSKLLRAGEGRVMKDLQALVARVNALEAEVQRLTDSALRAKTGEFRERLAAGASLDEIEAEAYAVVREASQRVLGQRHFDVQVIGAGALHRGMISEMKTGEGKTLVSTMPVYLNALGGRGVHLVTVNDYLAKRDAEWMGGIHRFLGLSVGLIQASMLPDERRPAYAADLTYGTNNEFGFDYLRDNMAMSPQYMVQRGHHFAIVDEVDSILVDEARTPLIISGRVTDVAKWYRDFARIVERLRRDLHYEVDEAKREVIATEAGVSRVEEILGVPNMYDHTNIDLVHHLDVCAAGQGAVPPRRGLRGQRRRGQDRRRVHRPHPRGPALLRGPAPGHRGQGGGADQGGEPDPGHHHPPELLPHVREAGGDDRHGPDRVRRVPADLQAAGARDPAERAGHPPRPARPGLHDRARQVLRRGRGHRRPPRRRASRCWWARSRSRSPSI